MMDRTLFEDAHAVLLPATDRLDLGETGRRFLDSGGVGWLLGENREECVARRMSPARRVRETAEDFLGLSLEVRRRTGHGLIAVDQEPSGICRLKGLVPDWPEDLTDIEALQRQAARVARAARGLGINVLLAPILDVVMGQNPWLEGRTMGRDMETVARIGCGVIRGFQSEGVAATAKHFPGSGHIPLDPAIDAWAIETSDLASILAGLDPFRAAIAAAVEIVMVGPAVVTALDPMRPGLRSPAVVQCLTGELGFSGIVLADDLDSLATLGGDSLATASVDALAAGCDMLLLADKGQQLREIPRAIVDAVNDGRLSRDALAWSAGKIRNLAGHLAGHLARNEHVWKSHA